jgi:hypothetical protein
MQPSQRCLSLQARRDVHAVAENLATADQHIAKVDAESKLHFIRTALPRNSSWTARAQDAASVTLAK